VYVFFLRTKEGKRPKENKPPVSDPCPVVNASKYPPRIQPCGVVVDERKVQRR
jgi:hypothetical protein